MAGQTACLMTVCAMCALLQCGLRLCGRSACATLYPAPSSGLHWPFRGSTRMPQGSAGLSRAAQGSAAGTHLPLQLVAAEATDADARVAGQPDRDGEACPLRPRLPCKRQRQRRCLSGGSGAQWRRWHRAGTGRGEVEWRFLSPCRYLSFKAALCRTAAPARARCRLSLMHCQDRPVEEDGVEDGAGRGVGS